jgi:pimeloyl-ACP methyl ester carboxylesterase
MEATMASPTCTDVQVSVTLSDGSSGPIVGRLCVPTGATSVQLLLHGFTYGQYYWDLPFQPENYSYVAVANQAGYATLSIDRLGVGGSYHPLSALVTLENEASAVHQVTRALRSGRLGGTLFTKVVLVGHSYGSLISFLTAGRYQNVDALVATGASHQINVVNLITRLAPTSEPATLDPKFTDSGLDPGYLTTRSGTRTVFHNTQNTDPAVIALDEQLKETGTAAELITILPDILFNFSHHINIPVLAVNGTDEPFFCNGLLTADCSSNAALVASERRFYGPGATLEALVVPDTGHTVTLARSAPHTLAAIQDWLSHHVPAS